jgi:hypothetical protein
VPLRVNRSAASASTSPINNRQTSSPQIREMNRAYQSHELAMRRKRNTIGRKAGSKVQFESSGAALVAVTHMAHPNVISVPECMTSAVHMSQMDDRGSSIIQIIFLGRPCVLCRKVIRHRLRRIVDWRNVVSGQRTMTSRAATREQSCCSCSKCYDKGISHKQNHEEVCALPPVWTSARNFVSALDSS